MEDLAWKAADNARLVLRGVPVAVGIRLAGEMGGHQPARFVGVGKGRERFTMTFYSSHPGHLDRFDVAQFDDPLSVDEMVEHTQSWVSDIAERLTPPEAPEGMHRQLGASIYVNADPLRYGSHLICVIYACWDEFSK